MHSHSDIETKPAYYGKLHKRTAVALVTVFVLATGMFSYTPSAWAKIYIDVFSSPRKLPIAVLKLDGPYGQKISGIITEDLRYSGLFEPLVEKAFMQSPAEPFNVESWRGTGVEAVVKGTVATGAKLEIVVQLYDAVGGSALLEKRYSASRTLIRPLAHSIANDIYRKFTGKQGVFRTKLAYITKAKRSKGGTYSLEVSDWDGYRNRSLNIRASALMSPRWSNDGKKILYSAERGRKWGIFMVDFANLKEARLFSGNGMNIGGGFLPGDKEILLSSSMEGTPDIYVLAIKQRRLRKLYGSYGIEVSPTISADGAQIAFVSDRTGSPQIYTVDKMGYNRERITYNGNYNTSPVWSPRGDLLAYCGRQEGKMQIFTISPNGMGLTLLTEQGNNEEPSFSPDGRFIAFTSDREGKKAVYIMRADGTGQKKISPYGIKAFSPRWSSK